MPIVDPPLLHRLQQRALDFGSRAIDLVGQQQIREDRPLVHPERAGLLVEDLRADDVGRQEVDRELHAPERQVDRLRDRVDEQRLGEPGHPLQQQVSAGEQRDQDSVDDRVLTDDDLADASAHGLDKRMGSSALFGGGLDVGKGHGGR